LADGIIVYVTVSIVNPVLFSTCIILSPVPDENPERFGELEMQVHEKVIPETFPVKKMWVVSPEQIIAEEEELVTTGTG
jgi:hypothetical protein